jgi:hypothetical protein
MSAKAPSSQATAVTKTVLDKLVADGVLDKKKAADALEPAASLVEERHIVYSMGGMQLRIQP